MVRRVKINPINLLAIIALFIGAYVIFAGTQIADKIIDGIQITTNSKAVFLGTYRNITGWELKDDLDIEGGEIVGQIGTTSTGSAIVSNTPSNSNGSLPPPPNVVDGDNFDIAYAAICLSNNTRDSSVRHTWSKRYDSTFNLIFKGNDPRGSCDRSAATAIRWSGADTGFPHGACIKQLEYLQSSKKWTRVDWKNPEPGDIIIAGPEGRREGKSHIAIYVGNKNIKKYIPNTVQPNGDTISGNIGNHNGPMVKAEYSGQKTYYPSEWYILFRRNSKDRDSKYWTGLPAGENWTDLWNKGK